MYSVLILCVIAAASAAPYYGGFRGFEDSDEEFQRGPPMYNHPPPPPPRPRYPGFGEDLFDTRTFWEHLNTEMRQLDDMLKNFRQTFPSYVSGEGIEGGQYKIVIPLSGYEEKDIAVKAREGVLMVQAIHKIDKVNQRSYLDVRTLPEGIDLSGTWTYSDDILTIQFPVKKTDESTQNSVTDTDVPTTEEAEHSREEMGNDDNDNLDVDVGNRGDNDKDREVETNEIPNNRVPVEATTYAVDLKDEVEFVTVSY